MAALKNALPGHLKSALGGSNGEAEFAKKHHGKTQSHMVSGVLFHEHKQSGRFTSDLGGDCRHQTWFKGELLRSCWSVEGLLGLASLSTSNIIQLEQTGIISSQ